MPEKTFDILEAKKAQRRYCDETGAPHFAPTSGVCWRCNKNIYEELPRKYETLNGEQIIMRGISVEQAGTELVTGCPHCSRSYCD